MSASQVFLDTNIVVYAYDHYDSAKHKLARKLLSSGQKFVISSQVIGEFSNVMLTKKGVLMEKSDLQKVIKGVLSPLLAHLPSPDFYSRSIQLFSDNSISFYDALIVQAALDLDCTSIYSEDLQHNQKFGSLEVVNPFK